MPLTRRAPRVGGSQSTPDALLSQPQLSAFVDTIMERLRGIETQLALLGQGWNPLKRADDGIPAEVVDLVASGDASARSAASWAAGSMQAPQPRVVNKI